MDDMFSMDPGAQMRILQQHKDNDGDDVTLVLMMETLSTTLVMGVEEYLRAFDPGRGIPQLVDLGTWAQKTGNGDVRTLILRALALILEHVPNASQVGATCQPLIQFAATSLRDCAGLLYESTGVDGLVEEALRVISFLAADEATQPLIQAGAMKDIVQSMNMCTGRTMRQCLDTMRFMVSVVNLTAGAETKAAVAPKPKKAKKGGSVPPPPPPSSSSGGTHEQVLREVMDVVVPTLLGTLENLIATGGVNDSWSLMEGVLLCMNTLVRRMYRQDRKMPADKVLTSECVGYLFQVMCLCGSQPGSEKKLDLVLSILGEMAPTAPKVFLKAILHPDVQQFYSTLIKTTDKDVTALLDDPFPATKNQKGSGGGGSANNRGENNKAAGLTISLALYLLSCSLSPLPDEIRNKNFALVPVHEWSWEDDMHSYSVYPEESSVMIEKEYALRKDKANVRVKSNQYEVDLWANRQRNPSSGVARSVRRNFQPKQLLVVDNFSMNRAYVAEDPEAAAPGVNHKYQPGPCTVFHADLAPEARKTALELLQTYSPQLIEFASHTTSSTHKVAASLCVAQLLYGCLPTQSSEVVRAMAELGTPLCQFLAESFVSDDDSAVDCGLIVFDFLLHNNGNEWKFHQVAGRFGLQAKLASIAELESPVSKRAEFLHTASSAHFAGAKDAMTSPTSPSQQFAELHAFVVQFRQATLEQQKELLRKFLDEVTKEEITPFEFAELEVAESLLSFLVGPDGDGDESSNVDDDDDGRRGDEEPATPQRQHSTATDPGSPASPLKEGEAMKDENELRQERISHFFNVMAADTACMKRLVKLLVQGLTFHRGMPDVESPISSAPVRCRPVHEAVAIASSISPNVDLCCNKITALAEATAQGAGGKQQGKVSPPPKHQLCPNGHMLKEWRSTSWSCDNCGESDHEEPSMACRKCDFDLCMSCFTDEDSGYECEVDFTPLEDDEPKKPKLPGYAAHIFSPVGDIEAFFRKGEAANSGGGPSNHDLQMLLAQLQQDEEDDDSGRMRMMHELLRDRLGQLVGGMRGDTPNRHDQFAGKEDSDFISSRIEMFYDGAGRLDYQEPFFGVLYRKAIARKILPALETFETALMAFDGDRKRRPAAPASISKALTGTPSRRNTTKGPVTSEMEQSPPAPTTTTAPAPPPPPPPAPPQPEPTRTRSLSARLAELARPKKPVAESSAPKKSPPPKPSSQDQTTPPKPAPSTTTTAGGGSKSKGNSPPQAPTRPVTRATTMREVAEQSPTRQRTLYFHVFQKQGQDPEAPPTCACGEFLSSEMEKATLDFARNDTPAGIWLDRCELACHPELTLLSVLHRVSHYQLDQPHTCGEGNPVISDETFWSPDISSKLVKSVVASALRVALLPPNMALPCWVNFILRRSLFLVPTEIRFKLASFLMHGARRALWTAIQNCGVAQPNGVRLSVMAAEWKKEAANKPQSVEKVRRDHVLEDSARLGLMNAERRFNLHVKFKEDEGQGLGPTLQFFTKAAAELTRSDLDLWRNRGTTTETNSIDLLAANSVAAAEGDFPAVTVEGNEAATSHAANIPLPGEEEGSEEPEVVVPTSPLSTRRIGTLSESFDLPTSEGFFPKVSQDLRENLAPASGEDKKKIMRSKLVELGRRKAYYMAGSLVARAMNDGRVFNLPLSAGCFELLRRRYRRPSAPHLKEIAAVDKQIAKTLEYLLLQNKKAEEALLKDDTDTVENLRVEVDALALNFTLPGYDYIELVEDGANTAVSLDNLVKYCHCVSVAICHESVSEYLKAFSTGFTDCLPPSGLFLLSAAEAAELSCGVSLEKGSLWTYGEMEAALNADHGYSKDSPQLQWLCKIVSEKISPQEQSKFLEFCTGCPRLPVGGLPRIGRITVVRKEAGVTTSTSNNSLTNNSSLGSAGGEAGKEDSTASFAAPDLGLPSVNTCFKYLKMPPYRSEEEMKEKLLQAVKMAGDGFDLT